MALKFVTRHSDAVALGHVAGTVLWLQPTNSAADHTQRVRSNASRISMISLADLANGPSGWGGLLCLAAASQPHRRDRVRSDGRVVTFSASQVSTLDYFHPSLSGQAALARVTWAVSWWSSV